jgi:hypothetical protein
MDRIKGHTGLYVAREPDNMLQPLWNTTTAVRQPLERVARSWRGIVMDTYALEKLTRWTPELAPPPESPFFRWGVLAGEVTPPAFAGLTNDRDKRRGSGEQDVGSDCRTGAVDWRARAAGQG